MYRPSLALASAPVHVPPPSSRRALWGQATAVGVLGSLIAVFAHRAWRGDLRIPLSYIGDGLVTTSLVKGIADNGWWLENPALGAPFGQQQHDYPHGGESLQLLVFRLMSFVTQDPGTLVNVYYFAGFAVLAAVTYLVMRSLGTGAVTGAVASLAFALLPYHFERGTSHLFRSTYVSVPLAALLLMWALDPQRHLVERGHEGPWIRHLRRDRVAGALLLVAVIASTETMTTSFTMATLVGSGLVLSIFARDWRRLAVPATFAVLLLVAFLVVSAPTLLFHAREGSNEVAARRTPEESAIYGLRLARFVIPPADHPIEQLARLGDKNTEFPDGTERGTWMGFVGLAGFLGGLYVALTWTPRNRPGGDADPEPEALEGRPDPPPVYPAALVIVVATLIGASEGFSKVAAVIGLSQVRTWNRISVLIAFFAFFLVAIGVDSWRRYQRTGPALRVVGAAIVLVLILGDLGVLNRRQTDFGPATARFESDEVLVQEIERILPAGAAVFQLPVATYPEDDSILDYDLMRLYLHSSTLRWSHGGVEGRPRADWREHFDTGQLEASLEGLLGMGFDGLTVYRPAYGPEAAALEAQLVVLLGVDPVVSPDGTTAFFDLQPFRAATDLSDAELAARAEQRFGISPP